LGENKISRQILTYLVNHPDAQDTLEGIMQWWLLHQEIHYRRNLILNALDELVQKGLIIVRKPDSSSPRYQANWKRAAEIKQSIEDK
jgi:hypothetical protein